MYSIQLQLTSPIIPDVTADFIDVIDNVAVFKVKRRPAGRLWAKVFIVNELEVEVVE